MIIKLHPDAEEDLKAALDYYFEIDINLERKFISFLDETFDRIVKFPNLYPHETTTIQKILMKKFPYILLYEQYEDIIMILAIFHTKRTPKELDTRA